MAEDNSEVVEPEVETEEDILKRAFSSDKDSTSPDEKPKDSGITIPKSRFDEVVQERNKHRAYIDELNSKFEEQQRALNELQAKVNTNGASGGDTAIPDDIKSAIDDGDSDAVAEHFSRLNNKVQELEKKTQEAQQSAQVDPRQIATQVSEENRKREILSDVYKVSPELFTEGNEEGIEIAKMINTLEAGGMPAGVAAEKSLKAFNRYPGEGEVPPSEGSDLPPTPKSAGGSSKRRVLSVENMSDDQFSKLSERERSMLRGDNL